MFVQLICLIYTCIEAIYFNTLSQMGYSYTPAAYDLSQFVLVLPLAFIWGFRKVAGNSLHLKSNFGVGLNRTLGGITGVLGTIIFVIGMTFITSKAWEIVGASRGESESRPMISAVICENNQVLFGESKTRGIVCIAIFHGVESASYILASSVRVSFHSYNLDDPTKKIKDFGKIATKIITNQGTINAGLIPIEKNGDLPLKIYIGLDNLCEKIYRGKDEAYENLAISLEYAIYKRDQNIPGQFEWGETSDHLLRSEHLSLTTEICPQKDLPKNDDPFLRH